MKVLTIGEEIRVLNSLRHLDAMDCGSSRMVFRCSQEIADFLKLNPNKTYVVKLAAGHGGFIQNKHEIETYTNTDYDDFYFAEIAAFGHFINIMEEVQVDDYRDFAEGIYWDTDVEEYVEEYCDYEWEDADEDDKARLVKVATTIRYLADIYGCTSDNGQLGLNSEGNYVAYDYGFVAAQGCDEQCSGELTDNLYDDELFNNYINSLIGVLHEIDHIGYELDRVLTRINDVETDINDYTRC